ncbi:hypothetical protein SK128_006907 [Halocaridina rubra]|uniref:Uncharacterized protein n=1 Tax=Halocaridina rubra TaxID=373956 RepID=A0AAN8WXQ7_HALRR
MASVGADLDKLVLRNQCTNTKYSSALATAQAEVLICRLTVNDSSVDVVSIIKENIELVHKLWELESIGIDPVVTTIEDEFKHK